jgi:hypothetical protein
LDRGDVHEGNARSAALRSGILLANRATVHGMTFVVFSIYAEPFFCAWGQHPKAVSAQKPDRFALHRRRRGAACERGNWSIRRFANRAGAWLYGVNQPRLWSSLIRFFNRRRSSTLPALLTAIAIAAMVTPAAAQQYCSPPPIGGLIGMILDSVFGPLPPCYYYDDEYGPPPRYVPPQEPPVVGQRPAMRAKPEHRNLGGPYTRDREDEDR